MRKTWPFFKGKGQPQTTQLLECIRGGLTTAIINLLSEIKKNKKEISKEKILNIGLHRKYYNFKISEK